MERPGRPRAALGNSPARASKNRLGCATLVLQITPADQAARTAARTEHPSIPSPRPVSCYHWPGPRHGPMRVELPGRPRATAQHEPPGAHSDALHLFCISRLPTKQQARRHGRSILQLPAHCPPVANTAWALGREHRRGYSGPDGLGQEPGTSPQEPTRARGTSAEHASRPRTHGARAARSSATPARRRQPFVHRRQPEAAYHSSARTAPTQSWTRTERCYPADQGSRPISADHIVPRNPHIPYKMYMAFGL